jgi:hypothetical protein
LQEIRSWKGLKIQEQKSQVLKINLLRTTF